LQNIWWCRSWRCRPSSSGAPWGLTWRLSRLCWEVNGNLNKSYVSYVCEHLLKIIWKNIHKWFFCLAFSPGNFKMSGFLRRTLVTIKVWQCWKQSVKYKIVASTLCTQLQYITVHNIKRTVSRDFRPLVFFLYTVPWWKVRRPVGEKSVILILQKKTARCSTPLKSNMNNQAARIAIHFQTNFKGKPVTQKELV
jgi:hypothetical protein